MRECEVYCIAACCGMNAFDITADTMQQWASTMTVSDVEQARSEVEAALKSLESAPERFYYLDCEHARSEVEEWFRTIRSVLAEVQAPA